jgi:hypothetical protein
MNEEGTKKGADKPKSARRVGRPPGTLGVAQRRQRQAIGAAKVVPLDVMLETLAERWEASKAAKTPKGRERLQDKACLLAEKVAPYLHARLQATTIKGDPDKPLGFTLNLPSAKVLKAAIRGTEAPTEPVKASSKPMK